MGSVHKKLGRVRKPRVHITYDVETGGAIEMKELPFIVGILSDLAGDNKPELPLKERKFIDIDRDNFSEIMSKTLAPTLQVKVENSIVRAAQEAEGETAEGEGKPLVADLAFKDIDDFRPESIAEQVSELKALLDARNSLRDLAAQLDLRDGLDEQLAQLVSGDEAELKKLEGAVEDELKALTGSGNATSGADSGAASEAPKPDAAAGDEAKKKDKKDS